MRVYKLKKIEVTYDEFGHCRNEDGVGRGEEKITVSREAGRPAAKYVSGNFTEVFRLTFTTGVFCSCPWKMSNINCRKTNFTWERTKRTIMQNLVIKMRANYVHKIAATSEICFLQHGEMNHVEQDFSLIFKGCRIHDFTLIQCLSVLKVLRN